MVCAARRLSEAGEEEEVREGEEGEGDPEIEEEVVVERGAVGRRLWGDARGVVRAWAPEAYVDCSAG